MNEEEKKLHIDDDWKSQAAAEKKRLSETIEKEPKPSMPEAGFASLVQLIAMQAMVGLGGMAGPTGREIPPNLDIAKLNIDMLDVLDKKTKGNLDPQEKQLMDTTLHQLRLAYVETVRGGGAPPASPEGPLA